LQKKIKQNNLDSGSIYLLSLYLQTLPKYNETPIKIFKAINRLRQSFPTHTDTVEGFQDAIKFLGLCYPIRNYNEAWQIVLSKYLSALDTIFEILT
jgi:hypothetical protein